MNLSEVLDAALPELPGMVLAHSRPPRLDPDLIAREEVLDGEPSVGVLQRNQIKFFRFSPAQWNFACLFDGVRSYEEIAALYTEQSGELVSAEQARAFADTLEGSGIWYKTPQEKNLALSQKLMDERGRRARRTSKFNLAHMRFPAWDPDAYFNWLDGTAGRFLYSRWCVAAMVLLFLFETTVFISYWSTIGPDAKLYYNFTQKSLFDLAEFWLLFLALGFIHESAHGLTCKHFGGQVHSLGLMLIYLMPAFYVDVTEVWVYASKSQRLATIIAGIWSEMVVCGLGMILWLNTVPGEWLHDFAYQLILITGIAVILINLNPLIKLDGYYFLTEAIELPDLKEDSTGFLTGWFQKHILRLNVDVPVVARRRAPFFVLYAMLSGAYSYMILFFVIRFSYNVASHWLAEFALLPSGLLAFAIFRGRLRSIRGVMLRFWNENLGAGRSLRPLHLVAAALLAVLFLVPFWRDREDAYFVIEPMQTRILHAAVPGRVDGVLVREGEQVRAGAVMLTMSSPVADAMAESAVAQTRDASFQAFNAELQGRSIGPAAAQQISSQRASLLARQAQASLIVAAPEDGVVLTRNPAALLGQNVGAGQPLLDFAAGEQRAVRVYIPTAELQRIAPGAEVALALPDRFSPVHLTLGVPGGDAVNLPPGLVAAQNYKGIKLPVFYAARMALPAWAGNPPFGLAGRAKIFGARRSLAGRMATVAADLVKAHIW